MIVAARVALTETYEFGDLTRSPRGEEVFVGLGDSVSRRVFVMRDNKKKMGRTVAGKGENRAFVAILRVMSRKNAGTAVRVSPLRVGRDTHFNRHHQSRPVGA